MGRRKDPRLRRKRARVISLTCGGLRLTSLIVDTFDLKLFFALVCTRIDRLYLICFLSERLRNARTPLQAPTPTSRGAFQALLLPKQRQRFQPLVLLHLWRRLFLDDTIQPSVQVHLHRAVGPRFLPVSEAVTEVDAQEDGNANVRRQEGACAPVLGPKDVEAVDQSQKDEERHLNVCAIGLDP